MPSAAFSNFYIQTNISPASCPASEVLNTILPSQQSTTRAFSCSNTQGYTLWPRNGASPLCRRSPRPKSTVLILRSKARSSMRAIYMLTLRSTIRLFVRLWPTSGLHGHIHYGPKRKANLRRSVWSFRSLVSTS